MLDVNPYQIRTKGTRAGTSARLPRPVLFAVLVFCFAAAAGPRSLRAGDTVALLDRAHQLFAQRDDLQKAAQAAETYRRVLALEPGNEEAAVFLARVLIWQGVVLDRPDCSLAFYQEAAEVTRQALDHHPSDPGLHYWLGAAYALLANNGSRFKALTLLTPIQEQMEQVLALNPTYDYGGPYRILGRFYTRAPVLLGGNRKKAEDYLHRALQIGPRYWLNHLYLADLYLAQNRLAEARVLLLKVKNSKPEPGLEPEWKMWRLAAIQALETRFAPTD